MRRALAAALLVLAPAAARAQDTSLSGGGPEIVVTGKRPVDPCYIARQVFVSPVGQPFRGPPDGPPPDARWFAAADTNHDGRVDPAEMIADADRWFAKVDKNGDGEIDPAEMTIYERDTVPEVSIFERTAMDRAKVAAARKKGKPIPYGTPVGAARFALLNIPHPLASADTDFNRGVTKAELEAVARAAFAQLAQGRPAVMLADLPDTPQMKWIRACAAKAGKRRR